jgi:hypothetical protein
MHIVLQYTFVIFIVISSYLNQSYLSSCVSYIVYILVQLSNKEKYTENIFFPSSTLPCLTNLSKMITLCQFSKMITLSIFQNDYIVSVFQNDYIVSIFQNDYIVSIFQNDYNCVNFPKCLHCVNFVYQ